MTFLRARYYSPIQGRFITRDPFPGVLSQPATLSPYAYALNNPALYTDPSGEFVLPFIVAAVIGGVINAGVEVVSQMLTMGPGDFGQKLRCVDWGQVGISFAAGAVAGFAGFTVFGGVIALLGTSFLANVAAGALAGIIAGQYGILTYLTLSGQTDQLRSSMFRWQDMVLDATLGGTISGVTYGLSALLDGVKPKVTSNLPIIKPGSSGGPSSGLRFPESVRESAFAENPIRVCVYCQRPGTATQVDHVIPKSQGGNATIENAQLACPHCNQSKGNRLYPVNPPPNYRGIWPPEW